MAGQKSGTTLGTKATAEGSNTTASGNYSHAEGNNTTASGSCSHAEGNGSTVSGDNSHAEGYYTTVSARYSHAEGYYTTASANYSHAEAYYTTASGSYSHAEGGYTTASGNYSHAEGSQTTASGIYSHAEGHYTTAQRRSQHVFGEYNILDTTGSTSTLGTFVEIVGNGANTSTRSNARTLDWNGNEQLAGNLLPMVTNSKTLGDSNHTWADAYITTIHGDLDGNAATATKFASSQSITLTGDTTGTASSQAGWSIATTTKLITGTQEAAEALTTSPGTGKIRYSYNVSNTTTGLFPHTNNANSILTLNRHAGNYDAQLGFSNNGNIYYRSFNSTALDNTTAWKQIAYTDSDISGNAATATKLKTAQSLTTKLDSTTAVTFDGSADQDAIPVTGTLPVANGGTAVTTVDDIFATYGVEYIVGTQTAATGAWTGVTKSPALYVGKTIAYKLPFKGSGSASLNLTLANGTTTGAKAVYAGDTRLTTHYPANSIMIMTWNGTDWRTNPYYDTDTYSSAQCGTAAATAAKVANCAYWAAKNKSYIHVNFRYANSSKSAITLNINSTGAKAIWIDGAASSASNYTLPAGSYLAYYQDNKFYFRTDGFLPSLGFIDSTKTSYGEILPETGTEGQIFFQLSDGYTYELPAGGAVDEMLVKNSATDRNVKWTRNYVKRTGDTISGDLLISKSDTSAAICRSVNSNGAVELLASTNRGLYDRTNTKWIIYLQASDNTARTQYQLYGAVWNDYAECRETKEDIEPGRCIREIGDDTLELTTERLMRGCEIVSDTFGFAIGQSKKAKTPTAASGRVLAYLYENRELAKEKIGWPVCSGPNGTVSIMTEEEEEKYPSRIIGTISAVPDYEIWYGGNNGDTPIQVNGRIWIRIR